MTDTITFLASLPPIDSAITFDGRGDGARIKLDIPATDTGAAVLLQVHGAGQLLKVTIEVVKTAHNDKRENHTGTTY